MLITCWPSALKSVFSVAPQLCEMICPRWLSSAYLISAANSGMPWTPSVSDTGLVSTTIAASGAMACAHSTSSVVSKAHPIMSPFVGSKGTVPSGLSTVSDGGSGSP